MGEETPLVSLEKFDDMCERNKFSLRVEKIRHFASGQLNYCNR